jgi:hypothetical protein
VCIVDEGQRYTLSMFAPLVGDTFRIQSDDGVITEFELLEAAGRGSGTGCTEAPSDTGNFVIVFHAPQATADRYLPQATYRLEHPKLGSLDLFVVPIGLGTDGQGVRYEAVFTSVDST